jgi:SnoaL-like domain
LSTSHLTTSSVEQRLARLEANDELRRLASEYCHGMDKRDLERFLAVWAADGEWVLGPETFLAGHDEIAKAAVDDMWPLFTQTHHWTSNQVVDWSGATPRGTADVSMVLRNAEGQWLHGGATFLDTYVLVDGRWLISRREGITHFTRPLP